MDAERYQQIKRLFLTVSELDEGRAAKLLDEACAGDPELREEVESLLRHHFPTTIITRSPRETQSDKIRPPVAGPSAEREETPDGGSPPTRTAGGIAGLARGVPTESAGAQRFLPGTIIAGRYRLLGRLGRGGMGEVFRADDLKLDQPIALKFLCQRKKTDDAWIARFRAEVRLARRVTHPNVNRIYDIGEAGGDVFISMEYVDGEDLASLLRRIGRMPGEKAVEIARQLCAGLGAAHDHGVLHRDLKPANIMIDGRGQVRITDFGIAALTSDVARGVSIAGTPAYMAPELLKGGKPSIQSDLYALGIVLYELVAGKRPLDERPSSHSEAAVAPPSTIAPDVDPSLEQVILRCLEWDSSRRPASTYSVATLLPGQDPLAAATADGRTPSPDMVAAAGSHAGLAPSMARRGLVAVLAGLAAVVLLADWTFFLPQAGLSKSPAVLADRAEAILEQLGHSSSRPGRIQGFALDCGFLDRLTQQEGRSAQRLRLGNGRPSAVFFWYRQGDNRLTPPPPLGEPTLVRALPAEPGMNTVHLDPQGRLLMLTALMVRSRSDSSTGDEPDWSGPFELAGLDVDEFRSIEPARPPPTHADCVRAWEGILPGSRGMPLEVEAASFAGRVVHFEVVPPWGHDEEALANPVRLAGFSKSAFAVRFTVYMAVFLTGLVLARHNVRLGRGDQRGAGRLAVFILIGELLVWLVGERHVFEFTEEAAASLLWMARAAFAAAVAWVCYMALEPYVRRWWPRAIISWSRILAGRVRDPLVGRDVFLGGLAGIGLVLVYQIGGLLPRLVGLPAPLPKLPGGAFDLGELLGLRYKLGTLIDTLLSSITVGLVALMLMLLFRALLGRTRLAAVALGGLLTAIFVAVSPDDVFLPWITHGLVAVTMVVILARVGLVSLIAAVFVKSLIMNNPITTDLDTWYAPSGAFAVIVIATVLLWALQVSLDGRAILGSTWLERGS